MINHWETITTPKPIFTNHLADAAKQSRKAMAEQLKPIRKVYLSKLPDPVERVTTSVFDVITTLKTAEEGLGKYTKIIGNLVPIAMSFSAAKEAVKSTPSIKGQLIAHTTHFGLTTYDVKLVSESANKYGITSTIEFIDEVCFVSERIAEMIADGIQIEDDTEALIALMPNLVSLVSLFADVQNEIKDLTKIEVAELFGQAGAQIFEWLKL